MPDRDPKMPKTQTSAPVSHEKPRDVRDERRPFQADAEEGHPSRREEDAAGGDRGIAE